jgi:hypothetical protein
MIAGEVVFSRGKEHYFFFFLLKKKKKKKKQKCAKTTPFGQNGFVLGAA